MGRIVEVSFDCLLSDSLSYVFLRCDIFFVLLPFSIFSSRIDWDFRGTVSAGPPTNFQVLKSIRFLGCTKISQISLATCGNEVG